MNVIVLLGAPGSGKGTIAGRLAEGESLWHHVSSGDLLRSAVERRTPCALEAEAYMRRGELVPDAIVARMIAELMASIDKGSTLLLDGYPRTVGQVALLDQTVESCGSRLSAVIQLDVPEDVLVERIAGRRLCPACGAGYHVTGIPPKKEGVCDLCGSALVTRADDAAETVRNRLEHYREQTVPLIDIYRERGLLRHVHGAGSSDEVVRQVKQVL